MNTQAIVIKSLNSLLRRWGNYYHHVCAKKRLERSTMKFSIVYGNGQRKVHPHKGLRWIKNRYFKVMGQQQWVFAALICKNKPNKIRYLDCLS
ncbi:MAG: group II intron maturase-specific domain-containing protein [Wolbachia sp.]